MRDLDLTPQDFRCFSVPHALCLAGEFQYALRQGALVAAVSLRVNVSAEESDGRFGFGVVSSDGAFAADEVAAAHWQEVLGELLFDSPDELNGLRITLEATGLGCRPEDVLLTPAAAVGFVCASLALRRGRMTVSAGEVASLADSLLSRLVEAGDVRTSRFYAPAVACVLGGAWYVGPATEPLNAQLFVPPDSLVLGYCPSAEPRGMAEKWEEHLACALTALGREGENLGGATDGDIGLFFEMASGRLDEPQTVVLYGLLRMHEMIREHLEMLARPLHDVDRLAEICDEESALLEDYFGFPSGHLRALRDAAVESGALGAKMTYSFGERPALVILAPGRRKEVSAALKSRFEHDFVVPLDIDADGVR